MALHVIQSQRVEHLIEALLMQTQQTQRDPFSVLQARHVIVPSKAIEVWLTERLAEKQGISANYEFHQRIRGFQWAAYQWVLEDSREKVRKANIPRLVMQWRIFHVLNPWIQAQQNPLDQQHALYQLIQRIYDSAAHLEIELDQQLKKQNMLYWVAQQVARLFSHYMTYRGFCAQGCSDIEHCSHNWLDQWGQNRALNLKQLIYVPKGIMDEEERQSAEKIAEFTQEKAQELEQWQRWLWLHIFHDDFKLMQEIDTEFWQVLGDVDQPNPAIQKIPKQLVIFTLLDLPPSQLYFIRRLAQYQGVEIYIYHYNPSQEYWADMVDPKWKARVDASIKNRFIAQKNKLNQPVSDADIEAFIQKYNGDFEADKRESHHPLLTRFGKQARDHFSLLSVLSSGDEGEWWDVFPDVAPQTLLAKIQSDVLNLAEPEAHQYALSAEDESIQIHVCHSSLRQLEVLKDRLIAWLAEDATRQPADILVLSPNLKEQESLIRSVFAPPPSERNLQHSKTTIQHDLSQDTVYLPIQIAGISSMDATNAWFSVLGRMNLILGRFTLEEFSDWLSLFATQQRYGLDLNMIERIVELLEDAGFKRGLDAAHLQLSLAKEDEDYRYTFKFALDRLAMGIAVPAHAIVGQTLSYQQIQPSDFALIYTLIQIYQDLDHRRDWMRLHEQGEFRTVESWLKVLMQEVSEFQQAGVDALAKVFQLIQKQDRMLTLSSYFEEQDDQDLRSLSLPLVYVLQEISNQLDMQLEQASPTGSITFSQIGAIRPLPYKLIVMLNLDSGTFPNRDQQIPFDLMQMLKPQLGDRSRIEDDQGAFLDAVLLAQDHLWLFYNGFDVNDDTARDPSSVVNEFVQHLAFIVATEQDDVSPVILDEQGIQIPAQLKSLYHVHHLQPFENSSFTVAAKRFRDQWYRVAHQIQEGTTPRQPWFDEYPLLNQDLIVLDAQQWIADVCFPARAYLKATGIENVSPQSLETEEEPLLLNGLQKYAVRDYLLKPGAEHSMELLQDQLPIGKTMAATWKASVLEHEYLQERLHEFVSEETVVTQRILKLNSTTHMNIRVPKHDTSVWCNVIAASASPKRYAQVWLEYLLWLAYRNLGNQGTELTRILVCINDSICFKGVSSNQAKTWLEDWLSFGQQAQQKPVILPAELVLKMNSKAQFEIEWDEQQSVINLEKFISEWSNTWTEFPKENSLKHPDWAFILQDTESKPRLEQDFNRYSYSLYAPLVQHRINLSGI